MKGMTTRYFTVCGESWTIALPNIWTLVSASGGEKHSVGRNDSDCMSLLT